MVEYRPNRWVTPTGANNKWKKGPMHGWNTTHSFMKSNSTYLLYKKKNQRTSIARWIQPAARRTKYLIRSHQKGKVRWCGASCIPGSVSQAMSNSMGSTTTSNPTSRERSPSTSRSIIQVLCLLWQRKPWSASSRNTQNAGHQKASFSSVPNPRFNSWFKIWARGNYACLPLADPKSQKKALLSIAEGQRKLFKTLLFWSKSDY